MFTGPVEDTRRSYVDLNYRGMLQLLFNNRTSFPFIHFNFILFQMEIVQVHLYMFMSVGLAKVFIITHYSDPDLEQRRASTALAITIIFFSIVLFISHFVVIVIAVYLAGVEWFTPLRIIEVIFRQLTFIFTIIFVFGFVNDCWCTPPWQWQIGALAVFMAYINFVLLLKGVPLLNFGVYINMLLNIVFEFIKFIILPFLLILSFAFPFYMLFVRGAAGEQVSDSHCCDQVIYLCYQYSLWVFFKHFHLLLIPLQRL